MDELLENYKAKYTRGVVEKSSEKNLSLSLSKSSTCVFKLLKLVGIVTNLLISSLSTSVFKETKSFLVVKLDVSTKRSLVIF